MRFRRVPGRGCATTAHCRCQSECGWLEDRFGVSWQVVPTRLLELLADPDPDRRQRAVQAVSTVRRIVVADLERAADGVPA